MASLRKWARVNSDRILAWGLGTGLALFAIHWVDQPVINLAFLPAFGIAIIVVCLFLFFDKQKHSLNLGPKYIWVPMLVIVASLFGRAVIDYSSYTISGVVFGIMLFAIYVAARKLGKDIFRAFIPFVVAVAISAIVMGISNPGHITGGIITNYCASAGFMIFGVMVNRFKWQWALATLVLIALFFVGALEGLFAVGVLGIIVLARRDWGQKLLLPIGLIAVCMVSWLSLGYLNPLWGKNNLRIFGDIANGTIQFDDAAISIITTGRWDDIVRRMGDVELLGHGFWVTMPYRQEPELGPHVYNSVDEEPVHNVPLVVVDQIGPLAGAAWLFVGVFCLIKTRWKYAWSAVLVLSVFDHFIWTQFAPYWWALVGISTTDMAGHDYIFKGGIA